jgi:hypothetical protein
MAAMNTVNPTKQNVRIGQHARWEMSRRGISEADVREAALKPGQVVQSSHGPKIYQALVPGTAGGSQMVLRLAVEEAPAELTVVTVRRSSKVSKYWQPPAGPTQMEEQE